MHTISKNSRVKLIVRSTAVSSLMPAILTFDQLLNVAWVILKVFYNFMRIPELVANLSRVCDL